MLRIDKLCLINFVGCFGFAIALGLTIEFSLVWGGFIIIPFALIYAHSLYAIEGLHIKRK